MKKNNLILTLCYLFILLIAPLQAQVVLNSENGYAPAWGDTLVMIGQNKSTIDQYVKTLGSEPAGLMVYTSIQDLSGLNKPFNNGAGVHHAQYLLNKYPNSVLQIGLYMVGSLEKVNEGRLDHNIDKLADWIKQANRPVYLRIGYEFDNKTNYYEPLQYRYAFRRVVDRMRDRGVENVAFVWHSGGFENTPDPMDWYPGDDYVDWFAISFFAPMQYSKVKNLSEEALMVDKPFMIAESTPAGSFSERAKLDWFKKFFRVIDEFSIQAVCYINSNWESLSMHKGQGYGDARIQKFSNVKKLWLEEMQKEKFLQARHINFKN